MTAKTRQTESSVLENEVNGGGWWERWNRESKARLQRRVQWRRSQRSWMKCYNTFAATISETKWFGSKTTWSCTLVIRPLRRVNSSEEVKVFPSPEAARVWREGGGEWDPISSRMVTARLKRKHPQYLHLVSIYASTFQSPEKEEDFYTDWVS